MKILVTGGRGFIGGHVVEELAARGYEPVVFDRQIRKIDGVETILGDIRDPVAVDEAVAHTDGVIHLAGVLGTAETIANPLPAMKTNIEGGLHVLDSVTAHGVPLVNIAVGNWFEQNPYSISKYTVERFAEMYRREHGTHVVTVRALNAYGPRQVPARPYGPSKVRKIMPAFICRALTGIPIEVYGDGEQVMDVVHVTDVARALVNALGNVDALLGHQLEIGTGIPTTVNDVAKLVADAVDGCEIRHLPLRGGETPGVVVLADKTKVAPLIDPDAVTDPSEGIPATVEWFRSEWLPTWES